MTVSRNKNKKISVVLNILKQNHWQSSLWLKKKQLVFIIQKVDIQYIKCKCWPK